jgi:hypothetical protein
MGWLSVPERNCATARPKFALAFGVSLAVGECNRGISPLRLRFGLQDKINLPTLSFNYLILNTFISHYSS